MIEELMMTAGLGGLFAMFAGLIIVGVIIAIGIYVYMSFAFMKLGQMGKLSSPGLAWIPGVGPLIIAFQMSKMHWWPWLLLIGFFIPYLNFLASLAFFVYSIIWYWKMLEAVKRPGWWGVFPAVPFVGNLVFLILIGIAAWGKK